MRRPCASYTVNCTFAALGSANRTIEPKRPGFGVGADSISSGAASAIVVGASRLPGTLTSHSSGPLRATPVHLVVGKYTERERVRTCQAYGKPLFKPDTD